MFYICFSYRIASKLTRVLPSLPPTLSFPNWLRGPTYLGFWCQVGVIIMLPDYSIPKRGWVYTVVKVDGATPKRWLTKGPWWTSTWELRHLLSRWYKSWPSPKVQEIQPARSSKGDLRPSDIYTSLSSSCTFTGSPNLRGQIVGKAVELLHNMETNSRQQVVWLKYGKMSFHAYWKITIWNRVSWFLYDSAFRKGIDVEHASNTNSIAGYLNMYSKTPSWDSSFPWWSSLRCFGLLVVWLSLQQVWAPLEAHSPLRTNPTRHCQGLRRPCFFLEKQVMPYYPYHPWDRYIYLHLVVCYGKCR